MNPEQIKERNRKLVIGGIAGMMAIGMMVLIYYFVIKTTVTTYIGCYVDKADGRVFANKSPAPVSFADAQKMALAAKSPYFGFQYVNAQGIGECWYGSATTLAGAQKYGTATNCAVINGVNCGGSFSNALYLTGGM